MSTKIEWCDFSWNPIVGCSKISEGCQNCYAEQMANRLSYIELSKPNNKQHPYSQVIGGGHPREYNHGKGWGWHGNTVFVESALEKPLHWKKPRKIFVCSMGDLFHHTVAPGWIETVMCMIRRCPQHTFQILTKRAKFACEFFNTREKHLYEWVVPRNVWMGITAENQECLDARMEYLPKISAKIRFVSLEPLLGPINLEKYIGCGEGCHPGMIDWVIVGVETGPGARPCEFDWIVDIVEQCAAAKIPVFVKSIPGDFTISGRKPQKEIGLFPAALQKREFPA